MILSIGYGIFGFLFLILVNNSLLKLFRKFNHVGYSLAFASLGVKLLFLGVFTIIIKDEIDNKIMYSLIILMGIIYSKINFIVNLIDKKG